MARRIRNTPGKAEERKIEIPPVGETVPMFPGFRPKSGSQGSKKVDTEPTEDFREALRFMAKWKNKKCTDVVLVFMRSEFVLFAPMFELKAVMSIHVGGMEEHIESFERPVSMTLDPRALLDIIKASETWKLRPDGVVVFQERGSRPTSVKIADAVRNDDPISTGLAVELACEPYTSLPYDDIQIKEFIYAPTSVIVDEAFSIEPSEADSMEWVAKPGLLSRAERANFALVAFTMLKDKPAFASTDGHSMHIIQPSMVARSNAVEEFKGIPAEIFASFAASMKAHGVTLYCMPRMQGRDRDVFVGRGPGRLKIAWCIDRVVMDDYTIGTVLQGVANFGYIERKDSFRFDVYPGLVKEAIDKIRRLVRAQRMRQEGVLISLRGEAPEAKVYITQASQVVPVATLGEEPQAVFPIFAPKGERGLSVVRLDEDIMLAAIAGAERVSVDVAPASGDGTAEGSEQRGTWGSAEPVVFESKGRYAVVMPMRLN